MLRDVADLGGNYSNEERQMLAVRDRFLISRATVIRCRDAKP